MAVQQLPSNTFCEAKWVVSADPTQGTHTTVQAAINAASSGDTVFLREGTYTENLTLKAGVNLASSRGSSKVPSTLVHGNATLTTAGTVSMSGFRLRTNGDYFLSVTGSAASIVNLIEMDLDCTNNTGIHYTSSNASSAIVATSCTGDLGTTGIARHLMTSAGSLTYLYCTFTNTNASTTANSNSAGTVTIVYTTWAEALATSSTGVIAFNYSSANLAAINATVLTTAGTGTSLFRFSAGLSGTASAISVGAGTTVNIYNANISSSNTNAITGAGTLNYTDINFIGSSSTINTTTSNPIAKDIFQGGTGVSTLAQHGVVIGNGTSAVNVTAAGTTGQVLTGVTGSDPVWGSAPTSFTWQVVTGTTQAAVVNNGYIANNAGQVVVTLPASAAIGDQIIVTGMNNATGWKVAQNANQIIYISTAATTTGTSGYLQSSAIRDSITMVCVVSGASTEWNVINIVGNITVN